MEEIPEFDEVALFLQDIRRLPRHTREQSALSFWEKLYNVNGSSLSNVSRTGDMMNNRDIRNAWCLTFK